MNFNIVWVVRTKNKVLRYSYTENKQSLTDPSQISQHNVGWLVGRKQIQRWHLCSNTWDVIGSWRPQRQRGCGMWYLGTKWWQTSRQNVLKYTNACSGAVDPKEVLSKSQLSLARMHPKLQDSFMTSSAMEGTRMNLCSAIHANCVNCNFGTGSSLLALCRALWNSRRESGHAGCTLCNQCTHA